MDLFTKLEILTDAAKYDVACTSSGVDRSREKESWAAPWPAASATALQRTADAFPC